ncbi:MAG: fibronectin type III domain-containing protein, partial [Candidatus Falkowbacteria bacterium]|nr:fibronectin type III domain-containing protein [Candidatus Falkowbacteria bacterium]
MKKLNLFIVFSLISFAFFNNFNLQILGFSLGSVRLAEAVGANSIALPIGFKATMNGSSQIDLDWDEVRNDDRAYYEILQSNVAHGGSCIIARDEYNNEIPTNYKVSQPNNYCPIKKDLKVTSVSITNLAPSTRYFYRIRTCFNGACSPLSDIVSALTLPSVPTNFKVAKVSNDS